MRDKWLVSLLIVALAVGMTPFVAASHGSYEQSEDVVNANWGPVRPTEPCTTGSPTNGIVGGNIFALPDGADEHSFRVNVSEALDIDPIFHRSSSAGCEDLGSGDAPLGFLGVDEAGDVPDGATHIEINYFAGTGTYTINIPDPLGDDNCEESPFC